MFCQTFATFGITPFDAMKRLSLETLQPQAASMAIHKLWKSNIKLNRRTLTVNLLRTLCNINCGTNDVMFTAKNMSQSSHRKGSMERFRKMLMREKLSDALSDEAHIRKQFEISKSMYFRSVKRNSIIDNIFQSIMRQKVESLWSKGRNINKKKVEHLSTKWKSPKKNDNMNENLRNVKYSDKDLGRNKNDKNDEAVIYGNVEVTDNMKEALKMNPKFMTYSPIDPWDMEVAVELGFTKYRYGQINKDRECDDEAEVLDLNAKTVDYGKQIATNLPTIPRQFLPKPASIKNETALSNLKEKFMSTISKYRAEHYCNDKGYPKSNLETSEKLGIKETKQKIDNKECLISKTDKSNKLSCDSLDNYKSAIEKHTENDNIIDHKTVKSIENKLNDTLKILNGIFNVGSDTDRKNNEDRVHLASISTNVPPPPLDGLRKDHKPLKPGEEASGPSVRPVCAANVAPNARMSHFLSKILNDYSDAVESHSECRSSEEMRAAFESFNENTDPETKKNSTLLSMDAVKLYPSMSRKNSVIAVKEMIHESRLNMKNFSW